MKPPQATARPYVLNFLVLSVTLLLSIATGAVVIPASVFVHIGASLFTKTPLADAELSFATILLQIRLPHTLLIGLTGAALGGSGAAYQGLFRNPLADPYIIGVASGAGLGAVIAMSTPAASTLLGLYTVPAAAFIGALLIVALVYLLARSGGLAGSTTLILAGVAAGSFATALSSFLMLQSQGELRRALAWLLGGASMSGWQPVLVILPYVLVGLAALCLSGHALNVLQFGDEQARQLGLHAERARLVLILSASLATAAAVAFSGIIGFVGLIIPHLARILWGSDYRRLVPLSIIGGASGLLIADLLARIVVAPEELPVGIVTALAGAPFFLWVLRRQQKKQGAV